MKRHFHSFLLGAALAVLCIAPAHALEYTFDAPQDYLFGQSTSDTTIYAWENPNVDRFKDVALATPGFGTPTSTAMGKGAGHFEGTSIWNGNVAVAGHNRGVRNDFGKLHTLKSGAVITLTRALGTRNYAVNSVSKISVNDTSGLSPTASNCITLYTCVENQPAYRWCVRGIEV